jgi:integrase
MAASFIDWPTEPFVPASCSIRPASRNSAQTRKRVGVATKAHACWDVRWTVDGRRLFRRFDRAGDAEGFTAELRRGHAMHWQFDPGAKRFIDPAVNRRASDEPEEDEPTDSLEDAETVFSWTQRYWDRKWPVIEPKGRSELARYLNRARLHLVADQPTGEMADAVKVYLRSSSLNVAEPETSDASRIGETWLAEHSLPMSGVGRKELTALVKAYAVNQRHVGRRVAPATVRRMVADLRQCWTRAVLDEVIEMNPWNRVDLDSWTKTRGSRASTPSLAADAEVVLSPRQVWQLADACVDEGSWGDAVRAFVLVMGFCGLRPSEACGLVVDDLELPGEGHGWVTIRRSRRQVSDRYLDTDDDPDWGPLKGRHLTETRRVPIPTDMVPAMRAHVDQYAAEADRHALVFQRAGRPFDLANFQRDVWQPARASLFPPAEGLAPDSPLQPKLSRLRRHDLRHSACSMWLRANVDVAVCQRWSGHKQLSVFLDVYQGLIPGREEEGVRRLEATLRDDCSSDESSTRGAGCC